LFGSSGARGRCNDAAEFRRRTGRSKLFACRRAATPEHAGGACDAGFALSDFLDGLRVDTTADTISLGCMVCGCEGFISIRRRRDGVQVMRCTNYEMEVIDSIADDLFAFYGL
jgi:primosomal replication protein N